MNIAVITGASSGMGREISRQLDIIYDKGIDEIWLISRNTDELELLSKELFHTARVLPMDLTNEKDILEFDLTLSMLKPNIKMMVNAAGYGTFGDFIDSKEEKQAYTVKLNCEALVSMTHIALQYMASGGRIIQFASGAAFIPEPQFSVYAASKAFVLSFSKALNEELKARNISVTAVCPGPVNTNFLNTAYNDGSFPKYKEKFISEVSKVVHQALLDSYHRKNISIYSLPMKALNIVGKVIPHNILLKYT